MVEHIYNESSELMQGTKHQTDWVFYHDALSLMKAKECKNWMRDKGILDRWILPLNGLNQGTNYEGHPVGNSPELMPLDTNLFRDLNICVDDHILRTHHLPEKDSRKFSISTIKRGVHAYLRILQPTEYPEAGSPPSSRIIQDCELWVDNLLAIYNAGGILVKELGDNRNGKRKIADGGKNIRGGSRIKGEGRSFLKVVESK